MLGKSNGRGSGPAVLTGGRLWLLARLLLLLLARDLALLHGSGAEGAHVRRAAASVGGHCIGPRLLALLLGASRAALGGGLARGRLGSSRLLRTSRLLRSDSSSSGGSSSGSGGSSRSGSLLVCGLLGGSSLLGLLLGCSLLISLPLGSGLLLGLQVA